MEEYLSYIENLAANDEGLVFQNSSAVHASMVMATIFKNSNDEIRIFAGNLSGEVSDNKHYNEELSSYLERNGKLLILLDDTSKNINVNTLQILKDAYYFDPNQVNIKKLVDDSHIKDKTEKFHFTVADKKMFRFELDTNNYLAKCSFNQPEFSKTLSNVFDKLFNGSNAVECNLV